MKTIAGMVTAGLLVSGPSLAASPDENQASAYVIVRIYDNFGVPVADITAARTSADAILREAGLKTMWLDCSFVEGRLSDSASQCNASVGPNEVIVRILASPGPDSARGRVPLGEALVDLLAHTGSLATVFADRVGDMAARAGSDPRSLLGRVIAHEIGHLLIGTSHHGAYGLMRAVWTDQELRRGAGHDWQFSTAEARRMHAGIVARVE